MEIKDYTGQKFNKLTFVKYIGKSKNNRTLWLCLCECGNQTTVAAFRVVSGHTKSCGCFRSENSRKLGTILGNSMRKLHPRISTARNVWGSYYNDGISFETFLELSQLPCHYCGRLPFRTTNRLGADRGELQKTQGYFTYNGLDRIDSSKNHSDDNVVPCCYPCNTAKNSMTREQFMEWIQLVYNHNFGV